jgi:small-conductance mechanosensitive channel
MFDWMEVALLSAALVAVTLGLVRRLSAYRGLFFGSAVLLMISALFPRQGNRLGLFLFGASAGAPRLPIELFGIAWWILGAWLVKSVFDLILRRTLFPDDNQPHARRLFADLASVLIYVVALVGIMDTVLKEPIPAVLATSGVLAIVLGLALQNTLADVFSGLAINVERPFGAGDWISMGDAVVGRVIEINWRATRIRTGSNELIVIPNSVVAKAVVTNHCRLSEPHVCPIRLTVTNRISPLRVIKALEEAARNTPGQAAGTSPLAYACEFLGPLISYELDFSIDDLTLAPVVQSAIVARVADGFQKLAIPIGNLATEVQIVATPAGVVSAPVPAVT